MKRNALKLLHSEKTISLGAQASPGCWAQGAKKIAANHAPIKLRFYAAKRDVAGKDACAPGDDAFFFQEPI